MYKVSVNDQADVEVSLKEGQYLLNGEVAN